MSGTATAPRAMRAVLAAPWVSLGYMPDAAAFAVRTGVAFVLAYAVAFFAQIDGASSAGVCVALVAQPAFGMSFSKAKYRFGGTLIGAVVALGLLAAFPQDRTMLLMGYAVWLGLCTVAGSLLRDFRAYGTVLSGYTAGIIALGSIDTPSQGLLTALDRVAAIAIGIAAVLLVNVVAGSPQALSGLTKSLRDTRNRVFARAAGVLAGGSLPPGGVLLQAALTLSALRSQATFAGTELPDGGVRTNGARHAIEAMLEMVTLLRVLEAALAAGPDAAWRAWARQAGRAVADGCALPPAPAARGLVEVVLAEAAGALPALRDRVDAGLHVLDGYGRLPPLRLGTSYDLTGAVLNAIRSTIALGVSCSFAVLAGWPGSTLLLIQSSAIIALLGAAPNPTAASVPFVWAVVPMAVLVGVAKFLLLPYAASFASFALVCLALMVPAASLQRHARLTPFAMPCMLYVALLLGPSNPQTYDLAGFMNTALEVGLAMVFVVVVFHTILPVSRRRRLRRVAVEILGAAGAKEATTAPVLYDRLARAVLWAGPPDRLGRQKLIGQLRAAGEMEMLHRRAQAAAGRALPLGWVAALAEAERMLAAGEDRRAVALLGAVGLLGREAPGVDGLRARVHG